MKSADQFFRYWPKRSPIPAGWLFFSDLPRPHGKYSMLIVRAA